METVCCELGVGVDIDTVVVGGVAVDGGTVDGGTVASPVVSPVVVVTPVVVADDDDDGGVGVADFLCCSKSSFELSCSSSASS